MEIKVVSAELSATAAIEWETATVVAAERTMVPADQTWVTGGPDPSPN